MLIALTALRADDRELMLLHVWDGLAAREIAVVLQVSAVTARARLSRISVLPATRTLASRSARTVGDVDRDAGAPQLVVDYLETDQLPRTPANDDLLRMAPHPGAERIDEGPFR